MRAVWGVLVLVTALKLVLAATTYGTNDVLFFDAYQRAAEQRGGISLYRDGVTLVDKGVPYHTEGFQHPPFIVHFLRLLGALKGLGFSFQFLFRLASILADLGTALLLLAIGREAGSRLGTAAICAVVASPVSLLVSGFHGNTDPVMVFFLVLAVYLAGSGRSAWLVGAAQGMATNIKLWPVVFVPVFFFYYRTWPARVKFLAAAGAVFGLGSAPYLYLDPIVVQRVAGYRSLYGQWGLSRVTPLLPAPIFHELFGAYGAYLALAVCAWTAYLMNRRPSPPGLLVQGGVVTAVFLVLSPGFGLQYLMWLAPWLATLGAGAVLLYGTAAGVFMALVYTFWCGGFPWYLADSLRLGSWRGFLVWHELVCWFTVAAIAGLFLRAAGLAGGRKSPPAPSRKTGRGI